MLLAGSISGVALADSNSITAATPLNPSNNGIYQEFLNDFAANLGVSQEGKGAFCGTLALLYFRACTGIIHPLAPISFLIIYHTFYLIFFFIK